jgi:cysteine desulfurase
VHDVYLDYNATTPVCAEAARSYQAVTKDGFGNPSSIHYAGRRAKAVLDLSRERIAATLGVRPGEVYFTSGGTEGNNLAIRGVAGSKAKGHVIVSGVEHPAVLNTCRELEGSVFEVTCLPVDSSGRVDPQAVADAIRDDTILVTVMWVNNETGVIQPVEAIGEITRERGVLFHTDAVQAFGRIPMDLAKLPVDLLTISGHKFCAPKGAGALYCRRGLKLAPTVFGGGQERGLRSGTENVPAIAAMAEAAELASAETDEQSARQAKLRDDLEAGILARIDRTTVNGAGAPRVANTSNIGFPGVDGEAILIALDEQRIAVSSASACAASHSEPSHVLLSMGLSRAEAESSIRFSLGRFSLVRDVDRCLEVLPGVIGRLRRLGSN